MKIISSSDGILFYVQYHYEGYLSMLTLKELAKNNSHFVSLHSKVLDFIKCPYEIEGRPI